MADRDAEFNLTANDRTGPAVESAADGFEHLGREADKATRKIDDLGDETGQLARKMLEAKAAALSLARQFDKTGDSKILKDFQRINREAANLAKVAKSLKFDPPEVKNPNGFLGMLTRLGREAGLISSKAMIEGASDLWNALPEKLKAGLIAGAAGAAVIFAPMISGAIQGAILAGVGVGAIGATALIAAQNEKVKEQYGILGQAIMLRLKDAGRPMTETLLAAVPRLSAAFDQEMPGIQRIMRRAAADLGPIIDDITKSLHAIMPALERAAAVGGDILGNVMSDLPKLTGALGSLLDAFSSGGRGGAAGLSLLVGEIAGFIRLIALLVQSSSAGLEFFGRFMEMLNLVPENGKKLTQLATAQERAAASAAMSASSYEQLAQSLGNTANMAKQLQDNFNSLFGIEMGVQQANLAVNMGMQQLNATLKDNKKTLDQSTQAGAENAQGILNQVDLLNRKREADIAAGNGTAEATAKADAAYAQQVGALRNVLIQMGFNAGAVDALIGKLLAIPGDVTTTVTTVFRTVYRTDGTPATGHSQNPRGDLSGLSAWAPARFNAGAHAEFMESGGGRTTPPVEVHSENTFNVLLDGTPFRAQIRASTRASEQRQAWRNRVGTR